MAKTNIIQMPDEHGVIIDVKKSKTRAQLKEEESRIVKSAADGLQKLDWDVVRLNSGVFQEDQRFTRFYYYYNLGVSHGLTDLLAFKSISDYLSVIIFLEAKRRDGVVSEKQKKVLSAMRAAGHPVFIFRTSSEAVRIGQHFIHEIQKMTAFRFTPPPNVEIIKAPVTKVLKSTTGTMTISQWRQAKAEGRI